MDSLARNLLTSVVFAACATAGIIGPWAVLLGAAWVADASGLGKAVFDSGMEPASAHLRLAEGGYEEARGPALCSATCAGHEAGWAWARERMIEDPSGCGGRSRSFTEGCWAYSEEFVRLTG